MAPSTDERSFAPERPAQAPRTLRSMYCLAPPDALSAACTALLLVDFQREFTDGHLPVAGATAAIRNAAELLAWARRHAFHVVHVRQESPPGSPLFATGTSGAAPIPALQPRDGELVRTKRLAGAFSRTDLDGSLRALGVDTLVCAGIMTHLALDSSVRDAAVLGYRVLVAGDACATRALPSWHGDGPIDAEDVHRTALAALADRFADVRTTDALVAWAVGG